MNIAKTKKESVLSFFLFPMALSTIFFMAFILYLYIVIFSGKINSKNYFKGRNNVYIR